jgi:hypothetical protein
VDEWGTASYGSCDSDDRTTCRSSASDAFVLTDLDCRSCFTAHLRHSFSRPVFAFQGKMQQGRTDSVRPRLTDRLAAKDKTLPRVLDGNSAHPRTPGALGFNALLPLDVISGRKLLYSNPRLLRSSQLGETCPPPAHAEHGCFSLAAPRNLDGASEAASRPGGRLAVGCTTAARYCFGGSTWPDSWTSVSVAGLLCAP